MKKNKVFVFVVALALFLVFFSYFSFMESDTADQSFLFIDPLNQENTSDDLVALNAYLRKPVIPQMVGALANNGSANFLADPLKTALARDDQVNGVDSGLFRQGRDWISETFGASEDDIIKNYQNALNGGMLPLPKSWTVQTIHEAYRAVESERNLAAIAPEFILVEGVGISGIHRSALGRNCILQLASQFNYLESPGNFIVPVSLYPNDRTQGPLGVVEAAAATLLRHAAVTNPKISHQLPNALHNVIPADAPYYKNGYFELGNATNEEEISKTIRNNIDKLEILPQWVINESSGAEQLHIFSAAPSYQGYKQPAIDSVEGRICNDLVATQYEAIAQIAVIRSVLTNQEVIVHLTQVGQGSFNNPPEVMKEAFARVAKIVKGFKVKVYIHVFANAQAFVSLNRENLVALRFTLKSMSKGEFLKTEPAIETASLPEKN